MGEKEIQLMKLMHLEQLIYILQIMIHKNTETIKNHMREIAASLLQDGVINIEDFHDIEKL